MSLRSVLVLVASGIAFLGGPAGARAERALLVVGGAAVKTRDRGKLILAGKNALEEAGWTTAADPPTDTVGKIFACVEESTGKCSASVLEKMAGSQTEALAIDRMVVIRVTKPDQRAEGGLLLVRGWVFRGSGELLAGDQKHCAACQSERLEEMVGDLTAEMVLRARARSRPATLDVRSQPPGATIYIDDKAIGATNFAYGVYAGKHTVQIVHEGYEPEVREVSVSDGERMKIEVVLRPQRGTRLPSGDGDTGREVVGSPSPTRPGRVSIDTEPPPSRLFPWLTIGSGVALIIGGGGLLLVDESDVSGGESALERRETTIPGIAVASAGAAVVGIGVVWLVRSKRARSSAARPTVGMSRDGAWLGLEGRF